MFAGKTFTYGELSNFPDRTCLFPEMQDEHKALCSGEPFRFTACDTEEADMYFYDTRDRAYHLKISGITEKGNKILILYEHQPYFLIRVPDVLTGIDIYENEIPPEAKSKVETFATNLRAYIASHGYKVVAVSTTEMTSDSGNYAQYIMRKRGKGFQVQPGFYVKVICKTMAIRKLVYNHIVGTRAKSDANEATTKGIQNEHWWPQNAPIETTSDDMTNYYLQLCREAGFDLCGWNLITSYEIVAVKSCVATRYGWSNANIFIKCNKITRASDFNAPDKLLIMSWDIECVRYTNDGALPSIDDPNDEIILIGMTLSHHHTKEPLMQIGISGFPTDASGDDITVICKTEREVLLAFAIIIFKLKPDVIAGFNDGNFDWQYYVERAMRYRLLETIKKYCSLLYTETYVRGIETAPEDVKILSRELAIIGTHHRVKEGGVKGMHFIQKQTKLEANESVFSYSLKFFGWITCDVMILFRVLYKNPEEYNLNSFLQREKLKSKEDMPIVELFKISRECIDARNNGEEFSDKMRADMRLIKEYCVYDAKACHSLLFTKRCIGDRKVLGSQSYVCMNTAFHRADGVKIRNLVIHEALKKGYAFSSYVNPDNEKYSFSGAYVLEPKITGPQIPRLTLKEKVKTSEYKYQFYSDVKYKLCPEAVVVCEKAISALGNKYKTAITLCAAMKNKGFPVNVQEVLLSIAKKDTIESQIIQMQQYLQNNRATMCSCCDYSLLATYWREYNGRPVSALDFSGLYPSLMMTYNISLDMLVETQTDVELLKSKGYAINEIDIDHFYMNKPHITKAYFIRHKFDPSDKLSNPDTDLFGLFANIQYNLKKTRKALKENLKTTKTALKPLYARVASMNDDPNNPELQELKEKILELERQSGYYDSCQYATKIFMNSFYGECGNKRSSLFKIEVAGGITAMGQWNLKFVLGLIDKMGCNTIYGDTDSTYLQTPEIYYKLLDIAYYGGEIDKDTYCKHVIYTNICKTKKILEQVSRELYANNGTKFLMMEFEEALYPGIFLVRKKYYGVEHAPDNTSPDTINVSKRNNVEDIFIRGLDLKRRGAPDIVKKICSNVVVESVDINNLKPTMQMIEDIFKDSRAQKWNINDFAISGQFRPTKGGTVNTFFKRINAPPRNEGIQPAERVKFVVIKKPRVIYDNTGKIIKRTLEHERLELLSVVSRDGLEIDYDHYVEKKLIGQLGRFVAHEPMFKGDFDVAKDFLLQLYKKDQPPELKFRSHKNIYKAAITKINAPRVKFFTGEINSKSERDIGNVENTTIRASDLEKIDQIIADAEINTKNINIKYAENILKSVPDVFGTFIKSGYVSRMREQLKAKIINYKYELAMLLQQQPEREAYIAELITETRALNLQEESAVAYIEEKSQQYNTRENTIISLIANINSCVSVDAQYTLVEEENNNARYRKNAEKPVNFIVPIEDYGY